jgi:3-methyl-2-oxobutanoate hydroxymethyltransferase
MAKKLTVAGLRALKGQRQVILTTAFDTWTAQAAEEAGVDMILAWGRSLEHSKAVVESVRAGAPNTLIGTGLPIEAYASQERAILLAGELRRAGVDIIYCSGLVPDKFAGMARQHIPCCGHVGYLPVNDTWLGGPRAVGKTWQEAKRVFEETMALEAAGCIAVEMEVVPAEVAAEITKRTSMLVFSMGSGPHCDGQFIFDCDILGTNPGHVPRHAPVYANFYREAVKAFSRYREDVVAGAYPAASNSVKMKDGEYEQFLGAIPPTGQ